MASGDVEILNEKVPYLDFDLGKETLLKKLYLIMLNDKLIVLKIVLLKELIYRCMAVGTG